MSKAPTTPTPGNSKPGDAPRTASIPLPKSKRGLKGFYHDVIREMKKVSWPTRQETNRLTGVVLAVCGMIMILLASLGLVFETLVKLITQGHT